MERMVRIQDHLQLQQHVNPHMHDYTEQGSAQQTIVLEKGHKPSLQYTHLPISL